MLQQYDDEMGDAEMGAVSAPHMVSPNDGKFGESDSSFALNSHRRLMPDEVCSVCPGDKFRIAHNLCTHLELSASGVQQRRTMQVQLSRERVTWCIMSRRPESRATIHQLWE